MTTPAKRRSRKAGLLPGTPVHIGEQKTEAIKITLLRFNERDVEERDITDVRECVSFKDDDAVVWINVVGLHQTEPIQELLSCFSLHPLVVEDILNTDQRPKVDDYGDYVYIVVKALSDGSRGRSVTVDQVSIVVAKNLVLSFQERPSDVFTPVVQYLKNGQGRLRRSGADYLAYALLDAVVDDYFEVLERLGELIETLEEELVANPTRNTLRAIHNLKREMITLTRSVWPLREVVNTLARGESSVFEEPTRVYLRDVYDHTIHMMDTIETYRDMLSSMLDIYLSSISNRLNEVMKVLTIIATIFMPLTFIAGVYGMNFDYMPELRQPWGYFAVLFLMLVIAASMLLYFRRRKWL